MTSKLTRERLEALAVEDDLYNYPPTQEELNALARMALAAMDSEPRTDDELSNLLWYSQEATSHSDPNYYCEFQRLATPGFIAWIIRELQERRKAERDSEPYGYVNQFLYEQNGVSGLSNDHEYYHDSKSHIPLYRHAQPAPDQMLCDFYEVNSWPDLVRELVKHVEQLQDSAKRNVKPWEDTFPETLLPAYIERIKQADEAWCAAMLTGSGVAVLVNDGTIGKPLTIILPDISSKAFWSGSGKTEVFHPEAYKRWVKEAIERHCAIARIDVEVK